MVEEMEKSEKHGKINEEIKARVRSDDEEREDLDGGEIVGVDDMSSAAKLTATAITTHPLDHSWTFWFDNPSVKSRQAAWGSSICPIYTFSSIEDLWSLYNSIHHPSKLTRGADFHCFKNQIEPKWEDPICANGGKWTATFSKGKSDIAWLYTLLAMIGEQFDHGDEICGAVVNVRARQEKIALWTKNAANEAAQLSIGKQWKEFLDYKDITGFIFHEDAKKLDRGAKNKYTT